MLAEKARLWRRQARRAAVLEGGTRLLGSAAAGLTVLLWLDSAVLLPQVLRAALLGAGLSALSAAAWRWLAPIGMP